MILEHKTFDLYEKMVFEKAVLTPPYSIPNNMSNEACFLYVINGTYNLNSAIGHIKVEAKDGVLMECGNYYAQWIRSANYEKCEAIAVHFYPEILKKIYDTDFPTFIAKARDSHNNTGITRIKTDSTLHHYISSMQFYFENPHLVSDELLILKLKELLLLLVKTDNSDAIKEMMAKLFSPKEYSFKQVVEANIFSNLSVEQLAQLANVSTSTFKREFNKIYQISPAQYFKTKKLEKAAQLLSNTNNRISDIAYDCGFNDLAHFSKSFQEVYKLSPTNYRLNQKDKTMN
ncbi:MAG: helix-turn-helix transcriptional regulator [Flavipsychrobacter sp.]